MNTQGGGQKIPVRYLISAPTVGTKYMTRGSSHTSGLWQCASVAFYCCIFVTHLSLYSVPIKTFTMHLILVMLVALLAFLRKLQAWQQGRGLWERNVADRRWTEDTTCERRRRPQRVSFCDYLDMQTPRTTKCKKAKSHLQQGHQLWQFSTFKIYPWARDGEKKMQSCDTIETDYHLQAPPSSFRNGALPSLHSRYHNALPNSQNLWVCDLTWQKGLCRCD